MTKNSYSYSQISTAYRCNQLYKYLFVDKIKADVPESPDLHFGTAMHLGIENILMGTGDELFKSYWDTCKDANIRWGRYSWDQLSDQAEILLARFKRLHAKKFKPFQMEQRLYGVLPTGVKVEGTPDFLGDYDGVPSIVDFKTAGSAYSPDKIYCSEQMLLYAYLASTQAKYKAEQIVYVVFVKGNEPRIQVLKAPISQTLMDARIENISAICKELDNKTVFTQNHGSCLFGAVRCDFWDKCHPTKEG